jgi:hypothetical protein
VKKKFALYGIPVVALLLIFYPLFTAEYAYLDEAHQLWYNHKDSNYHIFYSCGRLLTGLMMEKIYAQMTAIESIKYMRMTSVLGWAGALWIFLFVLQQWMRYITLDKRLVLLSGVYLASSISVAVYNGWAGSAGQGLPAFVAGLLSGHLMYMQLQQPSPFSLSRLPVLFLVLVLGLTALFWYQVGAGAFLIPFLLHFATNRKFEKPDRTVIIGVIAYLFIAGVYFFLFKYSLKLEGIDAAERTGVDLNILKKISFFVGVPLAQTFSFNFLFNLRSILSQAFYITVIAVWVGNLFLANRQVPVLNKLRYLLIVFGFMLLIYLPMLVAEDLFAPYRTMICLNLAMFIVLADMILGWLKTDRYKNAFLVTGMLVFFAAGFYNFRYNFLQPILHEYQLVRSYIEKQYTPGINKIYFLRPPEDLFLKPYHIRAYRDELGVPSTFKDWTPEPLVKQIIFEITHDKKIAQQTEIIQFTEEAAMNSQVNTKDSHTMIIDVAGIFNNKQAFSRK